MELITCKSHSIIGYPIIVYFVLNTSQLVDLTSGNQYFRLLEKLLVKSYLPCVWLRILHIDKKNVEIFKDYVLVVYRTTATCKNLRTFRYFFYFYVACFLKDNNYNRNYEYRMTEILIIILILRFLTFTLSILKCRFGWIIFGS